MTKSQIIDLINSGEVLIITKDQLEDAIKENVSGLQQYVDYHDFSKGTDSVDAEQIAFDIIEYLTN